MTLQEAEDIVHAVGGVLGENPFPNDEDGLWRWARPVTDLPCSMGRVKYAFFVYGEHIVQQDPTTALDANGKPITDTMISVYGMLTMFREDADEINKAIYKLHKATDKYSGEEFNKLHAAVSKKFGLNNIDATPTDTDAMIEFNNFLADVQNNYDPHDFKESDHPFLAYSGTLERKKYKGVSRQAWDKETSDNLGL